MSILDGYTKSVREVFPAEECVLPDKEEGVYNSDKWYECIIVNSKFPEDGFRVHVCRPYIWTDGTETRYGWIYEGQDFYDNFENPVRNNIDNYAVVAFRPVDKESFQTEVRNLAQEIIDNQVWDD